MRGMVNVEKLLTRISNYAKRSKRSEASIGKQLFKDGKALGKLQDGWRGISLTRLQNASDDLAKLEGAKKKPSANRVAA